jgi:ATP-dependent helicase/nuclease subunit B
LETVLRAVGLEGRITHAREPLRWVGLLDDPGARKFISQPAPTPPVAARPRQLSVTQVETLIRDPYAVYARTILRLKPLEAIDAAPDAADRGTFIHDALDKFLREFPDSLPENSVDRLLALGEGIFAPMLERPEMRAFWWPRFERIAHWFVEMEAVRRRVIGATRTEVKGRYSLRGPAGPFLLTAKADRIDRLRDGRLAIIDYKTGGIPTRRESELGYAPQLPLEAVIAEAGGFDGIAAGEVTDLEYWRLGGGDPAGEIKPIGGDPASRRQLIDDALPGLLLLVAAYDDPRTFYRAFPRPEWSPRYSDYVHLARLKEWSVATGGEE